MRESIAEWVDGLDGKTWGLIPMGFIWLLFWWVPERKNDGKTKNVRRI